VTTDKEMLKRILDVWCQVFTCDDKDKTVGEWRKEIAQVLTDATFYWREKYGSEADSITKREDQ
jgi:hypothetical protein